MAASSCLEGRISRRGRTGLRGHGLIGVVGLALIATACGGGVTTDASPSPSPEGTTYMVGVDGSTDEFNGSFTRFFPDRLTVHPGDRVVFRRPEKRAGARRMKRGQLEASV